MTLSFYRIVAYFFVYAFLGWCTEVAYQGVTNGKVVNRGFLNGPVCPIYGVGMVGVLLLLTPLQNNLFLLFVGGMIITTLIELFGGWALDKMFHMRWWDYSDKPFNLNGYICLEFCIIWGIGVLMVVRLLHPMIANLVNLIPHIVGVVLLVLFAVAMIIDIIVTYKSVIGITKSLKEAEKVAKALREVSDNISMKVGTTAIEVTEKAEKSREKVAESKTEIEKAVNESKDKLTEAVIGSKDKLTETVSEGKDKLTEAVIGSKDKLTETVSEGKDKLTEAVIGSKDKLTETVSEGKDKLTEAVIGSKDKITEWNEKRKKQEQEKEELERKYSAIMEKLQKQIKHHTKAFPDWHLSNQKKSLSEYIQNLKK